MKTFTNKLTGIIARETGVDNISWLVIEAYHLNNEQQRLNVLTIPYFIVNNSNWKKNEIKNTLEDDTVITKAVKQIIKVNSVLFQENKELYFLPKL